MNDLNVTESRAKKLTERVIELEKLDKEIEDKNAELLREIALGRECAGKHHEPGRVLVEPLHDAELRIEAPPLRVRALPPAERRAGEVDGSRQGIVPGRHKPARQTSWQVVGVALGQFPVGFCNACDFNVPVFDAAENPVDVGMGEAGYADAEGLFGLGGQGGA